MSTASHEIIKRAADLLLGRRYKALREVCSLQQTISTARLSRLVDTLEKGDRLMALKLRDLADDLRELPTNED